MVPDDTTNVARVAIVAAMAENQPILLVDIDGVISPFMKPDDPWPSSYEWHRVEGQKMLLSTIHGKWMHDLQESYDIAWASTWGDDAARLIGPIIGARMTCRA